MKFKIGDKVKEKEHIVSMARKGAPGIIVQINYKNNVIVDWGETPDDMGWPYSPEELILLKDPNDLLKEIL